MTTDSKPFDKEPTPKVYCKSCKYLSWYDPDYPSERVCHHPKNIKFGKNAFHQWRIHQNIEEINYLNDCKLWEPNWWERFKNLFKKGGAE